MPRIVIKTLPLTETADIPLILKKLGSDLSRELDLDPARIVITWEIIPANQFVFNGDLSEIQATSTHHPMVDITMVGGRSEAFETVLVTTIAKTISRELAVDFENVCVVINNLPPAKLFVAGRFVSQA